jgi:hypothetical protein
VDSLLRSKFYEGVICWPLHFYIFSWVKSFSPSFLSHPPVVFSLLFFKAKTVPTFTFTVLYIYYPLPHCLISQWTFFLYPLAHYSSDCRLPPRCRKFSFMMCSSSPVPPLTDTEHNASWYQFQEWERQCSCLHEPSARSFLNAHLAYFYII